MSWRRSIKKFIIELLSKDLIQILFIVSISSAINFWSILKELVKPIIPQHNQIPIAILWSVITSVILLAVWFVAKWSFEMVLNNTFQEAKRCITNKIKDIKHITPLHKHYEDNCKFIKNNIDKIEKDEDIETEAFDLYDHIISSVRHFQHTVHSIDCNIMDWENILDCEDKNITGDTEKEKYRNEVKQKRRVDATYMIYNELNKRFEKNTNNISLKRIFVIDRHKNDNLEDTEKQIIKKLTDTNNNSRQNKLLYKKDLNTTALEKLEKIQDIVIFDKVVAYKEFLLNPNDNQADKSYIITKKDDIDKYLKIFDELFENNNCIVFSEDAATQSAEKPATPENSLTDSLILKLTKIIANKIRKRRK